MKSVIRILLTVLLVTSATVTLNASTGKKSTGYCASAITEEKSLAAGKAVKLTDNSSLRLHPGMEIRCRFCFDELKEGVQNLLVKNGEYILRKNEQGEGGHLALFIKIAGQWEPRLLGPVIKAGTWYDVQAIWTGQEMIMNVNGERFKSARSGRITPGAEALNIGPISGTIDKLEIQNPSIQRAAQLSALPEINAEAPPQPGFFKNLWNSLSGESSDTTTSAGQVILGGCSGWSGWTAHNKASIQSEDNTLTGSFAESSSMLASPSLNVDISPFPFICIDFESVPPNATGHIDIITDSGSGSLSFRPQTGGRPTIISGSLCEAWTGKLKRMALSFSGNTGEVRIRRLALADHPVGTPTFYIRSLAAGRAKLRAGREESIIAGIMNIGGEAENITATLKAPKGVKVLGKKKQTIPYLGMDDFDMTEWKIRADKPGEYTLQVVISSKGSKKATKDLPLLIESLPDIPKTGYVPKPQPAKTDYINLMHYCALWKEGTHWGWKRIEPWPEKRPAIGWYDEGTPEVADWHIKYALEHGINGFIYCWYRAHYEPEIEHRLGHAIHDGLYKAKYGDQFTFTIMWENGCAKGVKDEADLLNNLMPFWIKNYFTHPSYLKIDNQPVLFVWQPRQLLAQLGGPEKTKQALVKMRAQCKKAGFNGLRIIACLDHLNPSLAKQIAESEWDAVSGYNLGTKAEPVGFDPAGLAYRDHADVLSQYKQTWIERDASTGDMPDIPNIVMGRDDRPWGRVKPGKGSYIADPKAENFEKACREAKEIVDAKPSDSWYSNIVVFDNWTEFGEGHYIEPTTGTGFTFLNAIKGVFCTDWADESITDIIPEDIGMPPPQKRYEKVREGFGDRMPWQPIRITGELVAKWDFDTEEKGHFSDSSSNNCQLRNEGVSIESGRGGKVLQCGKGAAVCAAPAAFFHPGGITVSLWCKPTEAKQSDRWMLSTVTSGADGYRLGLGGGCPRWQVPKGSWSHGMGGEKPLPINEWSHVAATFDNKVMRLYVNGKEVGNLERQGFINKGSSITVGGYSSVMERAMFKGQMDEVRVYRRVLSAEEIAELAK